MDLIVNANILRHLSRLFDRSAAAEPTIEHRMDKPLCPALTPEEQPFPRKRPEEVGLSSRRLASFLKEVQDDPSLTLHGILIVRKGAVVCDAVFGPYRSCFWHEEHSLSKSVTATAVGLLIDEGKLALSDRVVRILEKRIPPLAQITHQAVTVRHLLTMTSGVSFAEAGTVVENNWLRAFFESRPRTEPGKTFSYNSLNSYVLAAVVREITGQGLCDYLKPRLFDPLGITVYHWEKSPEGLEAGGWGLYLRREDAAKIGQLYLNGGVWQGNRLLSETWIRAATSEAVKTPEKGGFFDYGYHIWVSRQSGAFLFNGMFGQDMLALPEKEMLIVTNGGIEQFFQQSSYYRILRRYFDGKPFPEVLPRDRRGEAALKKQLADLAAQEAPVRPSFWEPKKALPAWLEPVIGKTFVPEKQPKDEIVRTASVTGTVNQSLLPFMEQLLRNRYARGINAFTFSCRDERLFLTVREGDRDAVLPISPGKTVFTVLHLSETDYHAAVTADFARDEDGRGVLKLDLAFPELSSSRQIKIFFERGKWEVRMTESPGIGLTHYAVGMLEDSVRGKKIVVDLLTHLDADLLYYKLKNTLAPVFFLYPEETEADAPAPDVR